MEEYALAGAGNNDRFLGGRSGERFMSKKEQEDGDGICPISLGNVYDFADNLRRERINVQTIEAAVLVPLGLGLVILLLMLTFFLHDGIVLEAEYAKLMLTWQNADSLDRVGEVPGETIGKGTLITQANITEKSFGTLIGRIKIEETRRLFRRGLSLLSIGNVDESSRREITWIKVDAFWLKRIWRASEFG